MLKTEYYEKMLNAYHITELLSAEENVIMIDELIFPHPIPCFQYKYLKYVILLNHERVEYFG